MSRSAFFYLVLFFILAGVGGFLFYIKYISPPGPGAKDSDFAIREFLPFGSLERDNQFTEERNRRGEERETLNLSDDTLATELSLKQITEKPVAGFVSFEKGDSTILRYVERETGHIYDFNFKENKHDRVSNTTIPRVREALLTNDGNNVILRYVNESGVIQTYLSTVIKGTTTESGVKLEGEIRGTFLESNILEAVLSPLTDKLLTLIDFNGTGIGTSLNLKNQERVEIFESDLSEWIIQWINDKTLFLSTKPSARIIGYAYFVDIKTGVFKKIISGLGLTALSSENGNVLLISENGSKSALLSVYDTIARSRISLGLQTIADKCVFANATTVYCAVPKSMPNMENGYPDSWYQGLISFDDNIWKIDVLSGTLDSIIDLSGKSREIIDAIRLTPIKGGEGLIFQNKIDGSLWTLKLKP